MSSRSPHHPPATSRPAGGRNRPPRTLTILLVDAVLLVGAACAVLALPRAGDARQTPDEREHPPAMRDSSGSAPHRLLIATYLDLAPAQPNGETIVLLHGTGFSSAYWYQTARALQRDGYRVIVPEQFCLEGTPGIEPFGPLFEQLAREMHVLLKSLGVARAHLLGCSLGGRLAIRYALMFPRETQSLLLLDPGARNDRPGNGQPHTPTDGWRERLLRLTPEKVRAHKLQSEHGASRSAPPPHPPSRQFVSWHATTASD